MAKANFIQSGNTIDYIAKPNAIKYLDVVPLISCIGVALTDIEVGDSGSLSLTGVYDLLAATPLVIDVGDKVYWDKVNGQINKTDTDIPAGIAISPKGSATTTARIKIG